jgi:branched-chain amino acid transport system permease protein
MQDALARGTDYWRAAVGALILLLVLLFPRGIGGAFDHLSRKARA